MVGGQEGGERGAVRDTQAGLCGTRDHLVGKAMDGQPALAPRARDGGLGMGARRGQRKRKQGAGVRNTGVVSNPIALVGPVAPKLQRASPACVGCPWKRWARPEGEGKGARQRKEGEGRARTGRHCAPDVRTAVLSASLQPEPQPERGRTLLGEAGATREGPRRVGRRRGWELRSLASRRPRPATLKLVLAMIRSWVCWSWPGPRPLASGVKEGGEGGLVVLCPTCSRPRLLQILSAGREPCAQCGRTVGGWSGWPGSRSGGGRERAI